MLEERIYTQEKLTEILGTKELKNIKRKLERYNIEFTVIESNKIEIHKLNDKFKVFCILDLGFTAQTDFTKLKYFMYYFFNDEKFNMLSHTLMEEHLKDKLGKSPCRQTIRNWISKLEKQDLFIRDGTEYKYFSVYNNKCKEISHEEYKNAWNVYWKYVNLHSGEKDFSYYKAFQKMLSVIGGKAVKRPIVEKNGFYSDIINMITEYALESIDKDNNSE